MMQEKISTGRILLNLLAIAIIFLLPHSGIVPFPFGYAIVLTIGIWLYLKVTKENFNNLGFSFKRFEPKAIVVGAILAIVTFVFLQYAFFPVLHKIIPLEKGRLDGFTQIRHHFINYLFFVLLGFIFGGWYEEIAFHGFIFTRLEKMIGGRYALPVSFIIANIIFGLYHFQLGASGVINAFMAGCVYHAVILKYNRNLWYGFFVHGFFDAIAFTYIYLGYW
ncbi:MAG: CPBP family glutamic-type intramembrane protease [Chitinophagaceae bacterium]